MKKLSTILSVILCLLCSSRITKATHAAGADLTYQWLGGNDYQITCTFYRDCFGIEAPAFMPADISSQNCSYAQTYTMDLVYSTTGNSILDYCPGQTNMCNGGALTGYELYVYQVVVTLPFSCDDWRIATHESARNDAITNLQDPGTYDLYVEATLDNLNTPFNNSPVFANKPLFVSYVNQAITINNGAFDPDGDSLVITSVNPLDTLNGPIPYVTGYSSLSPLSSSAGFALDAGTGDISFNPDAVQIPVISLKIDEFRNGVHVGSTMRDIQVLVVAGSDQLPSLTGISGTSNYITATCPGDTLSFSISSSDPDAGQVLTVSWDSTIADATFDVSTDTFPIATFTWITDTDNVSPTPYLFTVTVKDNACPYNGFQTFSYKIFVNQCSTDSVWPGDANGDYNCDLYDVLPIGLAYGTSGPPRFSPSITWEANSSVDWSQSLLSGINYKHADCNGDGVIDTSDMDAIQLNYGLTHLKLAPSAFSYVRNIPDLFFDPIAVTVEPNSTVSVPVKVSGEVGLNNFYGITFTVQFDPTYIEPGSVEIDFTSTILAINNPVITFSKDFQSSGSMDIAIVGIDPPGSSQYGLIATLNFTVLNNAPVGQTIPFSFANVKLIDATGAEITVNTIPITFTVEDLTNAEPAQDFDIGFTAFPNPAYDYTTLSWYSEQQMPLQLKILDLSGNVVFEKKVMSRAGWNYEDLTSGRFAPGNYIINYSIGSMTGIDRLVIAR